MSFLADLEATALSDWLSISMLGFPTLIALHSIGMAVVVGLALVVALRLHGLVTGIDGQLVTRLLTIAAWGFVLNLLTGIALFITRGTDYITSAIFLVKMLLVVVSAVILFWLRERLAPADPASGTVAADPLARRLALVAATTWFAAVVAGRLIAYLSDLYR